jgi:hypothetical protein
MKRHKRPASVIAFSTAVPKKATPAPSIPQVTELCAQMRQWVDELQWLTLNKPNHAWELLYLAHKMYARAQKPDAHGSAR